jgi:hypothetical protein
MPATKSTKTVTEISAYITDLIDSTCDLLDGARAGGQVARSAAAQLAQLRQILNLICHPDTTTAGFRSCLAGLRGVCAAFLQGPGTGPGVALIAQGQLDVLDAVASFIDNDNVTRG